MHIIFEYLSWMDLNEMACVSSRLQAIRDLLSLTENPDQNCKVVTEIARTHLDEVNRRMARLAALKLELERMVEICRGGRVADCRIIETLADHAHGHCLVRDHC